MFDDLIDHVGWRRLRDKIAADKDRVMANLAKRMLDGEEVPQSEIDFLRAFYLGAEWILGHPQEAMKNLEEQMQRFYRSFKIFEALSTDEKETPYV